LDELGGRVYRGLEVTRFVQDDAGVDVHLADGSAMRAGYLVGADGGRSVVRREASIGFEGADATRSHLIAEVELAEEPEWGMRLDAVGVHALGRVEYTIRDGKVSYADAGPAAVMLTEPQLGPAGEPTLEELRAALVAVYGTDFGVHNPTWLSRFTDATRQAVTYRTGRVLLAGDAAHIHSPSGGQGIGLGLSDAVNLGWKLAAVVSGAAGATLLDSYQAERHPAAARILKHTMAQSMLQRGDARTLALRDTVDDLLTVDGARRKIAAMIHGLDVRYDLGDGHPLLGRRMPDLDLATAGGSVRTYSLLHRGRAVLLNLGAGDLNVTPWCDRVQVVDASYDGTWELPLLGAVPAPRAVLVRPDGHVAWVGEDSNSGLTATLTSWFGRPAPPERPAPSW
jgi:hypothetical protein